MLHKKITNISSEPYLFQEYGMTPIEKLAISQGICTPLLKKIRADLQRNIEESEENVNRLNPRFVVEFKLTFFLSNHTLET